MGENDYATKGLLRDGLSPWLAAKTNFYVNWGWCKIMDGGTRQGKLHYPSSDKIMGICEAIGVSPEWLLSGVDPAKSRAKNREYYVVDVYTDAGILIGEYNKLDKSQRDRILGYVEAFSAMKGKEEVR